MSVSFDEVKRIIHEQLSIDKEIIVQHASISNDLGIDSLDLVELVMGLEESFNISISDEDSRKFKTVQDICDYINLI